MIHNYSNKEAEPILKICINSRVKLTLVGLLAGAAKPPAVLVGAKLQHTQRGD